MAVGGRQGYAPRVRSSLLLVALVATLVACRRESPAPTGDASASASAEPVAAAPVTVFAGQPIVLRDVRVGDERGALMVRLEVDVPEKREGRVLLPFRASCVAGGLRVVHLGRVINPKTEKFDLGRTGAAAAYVERGIDHGTTRPTACDLTFRVAPIGAAKDVIQAREETVCWNGDAVVAGRCDAPPATVPKDSFVAHDLRADIDAEGARIFFTLQLRESPKTSIDAWADLKCKDGAEARATSLVPRSDHFQIQAGEAVPLVLRGTSKGAALHVPCTLEVHAGPFTEEVPITPPAKLGTFCARDGKVDAGACTP